MEKISYPTKPLAESVGVLPIGVKFTNEEGGEPTLDKSVAYRKLSHNDLKMIWNKTLAKNHPYMWVGMICAMVTESIAGQPTYELFKANKFNPKKLPAVIYELTTSDVNTILYSGHFFQKGDGLIKDIPRKCPHCEHLNHFDVNIGDLPLEYVEDDIFEISIDLIDGFRITTDDGTEQALFKSLTMTIPTLGHAIQNETHFRLNRQGTFSERVYAKNMVSIVSADGEPMAEERMKQFGHTIFNWMSAEDSKLIEQAMANVPTLIIGVEEICQNCSEDVPVIVETSFLYQRH